MNDSKEERGAEERRQELLLRGVRQLREVLPGDSRYGDALSTAGRGQSQLIARRLAEATEKRPSLLREAGLSALQVWESITDLEGRGEGERELAIVFTDLVNFSNWALRAGDEQALALLRDVSEAIEPPVRNTGGDVVKRLGDGMMATFPEPGEALDAVFEAQRRLAWVEAPGYRPQIRAGIHVGYPQRIGGDYLGVDVNIAARIAEGAKGDQVLVSADILSRIDKQGFRVRRKRFFRGKGVPPDVAIYSLRQA
jgi:adenylate cyclase